MRALTPVRLRKTDKCLHARQPGDSRYNPCHIVLPASEFRLDISRRVEAERGDQPGDFLFAYFESAADSMVRRTGKPPIGNQLPQRP